MDLDKRLFTLRRNDIVSIATIEGRVKPKLAIGDYQQELLKNPVKDAKLIVEKEFYIHTVLINTPEPQGYNPVGVDVGMRNLSLQRLGKGW